MVPLTPFTALQCFLVGLAEKRAKLLIVYVMSDLVALSLVPDSTGVLTGLQSCMPYLLSKLSV